MSTYGRSHYDYSTFQVQPVMTRELNDWQRLLLNQLHEAIDPIDRRLVDSASVGGTDETFVHIHLGDVEAWLYTDGAHLRIDERNIHFESVDYDSRDELMRSFVQAVREAVQKHRER